MRIGIISTPWAPVPPPAYGGIELVVDLLARGFHQAGHDVLLVATGDSTCPVPRTSVLPKAEGDRIGNVVPELLHVLAAYDAVGDCDIVHDHTLVGPVHSEQFPDLPVLTTLHGPLDGELAKLYERIAERVPLIAISEAQCRPVPRLPVARVIHHGIDVENFPFGEGGDYFLYLGRMAPIKGAHRAMEVAHRAKVPLVLAAKMRERWEREYFERDVAPYLNDEQRYVGEVDHQTKLDLLAGARAVLFPIRWNEPFGMVMIEAMACGTPVLAFREGAAPEVVDDGRTGFLCDDEDEMVKAISRLDDIDRAACRAHVESHFSLERMVADHVALFQEVLDGRLRQAG